MVLLIGCVITLHAALLCTAVTMNFELIIQPKLKIIICNKNYISANVIILYSNKYERDGYSNCIRQLPATQSFQK